MKTILICSVLLRTTSSACGLRITRNGGSSNLQKEREQAAATSFDDALGGAMRVLLYVTTAGSPQHKTYLKCQADLLRRSPKLAKADVLLYASEHEYSNESHSLMLSFLEQWPMPHKRIIYDGDNPGRQAGAMKAMHVAFSQGWFRGYDWVIRINPDVIFYDELQLFTLMERPQNWGVFAICVNASGRGKLTHTDFFAVRPKYVDENAFHDWKWRADHDEIAEQQATAAFERIYSSGNYAFLKPTPIHHPYYRLQDGGIWHAQPSCDETLKQLGWETSFHEPNLQCKPRGTDALDCNVTRTQQRWHEGWRSP